MGRGPRALRSAPRGPAPVTRQAGVRPRWQGQPIAEQVAKRGAGSQPEGVRHVAEGSFEHAAEARAALRAIVSDPDQGAAVLSSGRVTANLLKDLLPDAPRETSILVAAADHGLAASLRERVAQGMDTGTAVRLTASSFATSTGFSPDACLWAVNELALALGMNVPGAAGPAGPGGLAGVGGLAGAAGPAGTAGPPGAASPPGGATPAGAPTIAGSPGTQPPQQQPFYPGYQQPPASPGFEQQPSPGYQPPASPGYQFGGAEQSPPYTPPGGAAASPGYQFGAEQSPPYQPPGGAPGASGAPAAPGAYPGPGFQGSAQGGWSPPAPATADPGGQYQQAPGGQYQQAPGGQYQQAPGWPQSPPGSPGQGAQYQPGYQQGWPAPGGTTPQPPGPGGWPAGAPGMPPRGKRKRPTALIAIIAGVAVVAIAGVAIFLFTSNKSSPPKPPVKPPVVSIGATTASAKVGSDLVVYYLDGKYAGATISSDVTKGTKGEVAKLTAQQFPFSSPPAVVSSTKITGRTQHVSFHVTPSQATRYQIEVFASSRAAKPLVKSGVQIVYVDLSAATKITQNRCRRPECFVTIQLTVHAPAGVVQAESSKHVDFYFALNLSKHKTPPVPKQLTLQTHVTAGKATILASNEFRWVIAFKFRVGKKNSRWDWNACTPDTESADGIGLPGHHGCGDTTIPVPAGYLG
jgi:hypothetical protein